MPRKTTEPTPVIGPSRVDETLTYRLHRLHRFSDRDSARAYQDEVGMSMSDGRCLAAIGTFGAMSIKNLADKANLDKAQASRSAQSLVEQKLVVKTGSLEDGRGVVLELTPAGQVHWRRAMDVINKRNQQIFGKLSPLEQLALGEILDRLIAAYET